MEGSEDTLVARLQERAADPNGAPTQCRTRFTEGVQGMSFGELRLNVESIAGDLSRLVSSIQSGTPIDPDLHEKAESVAADMSTPADRALPPPATAAALDDVEAQLGLPLPALLRRLYLEVADGGFGPEGGLISAADMASAYLELRAGSPSEVEDDEWPEGLLPLVAVEAGHTCLDAATGRMHESDFEEVDGRGGRRGQLRAGDPRGRAVAGGVADGLAGRAAGAGPGGNAARLDGPDGT